MHTLILLQGKALSEVIDMLEDRIYCQGGAPIIAPLLLAELEKSMHIEKKVMIMLTMEKDKFYLLNSIMSNIDSLVRHGGVDAASLLPRATQPDRVVQALAQEIDAASTTLSNQTYNDYDD